MALDSDQLARIGNFIPADILALEDALDSIGGGVAGAGTQYRIPMFADTEEIGDSSMYYLPIENTTFVENRLHVSVDLNEPLPPSAAQDPALIIVTRGTNCTAHDGGVQSFSQQHYNLDVGSGGAASAIAQGGLFAVTATKTGAGSLINTGVVAGATGGDTNYAYQGVNGVFRHNESMIMGTPMVVGGTTLPVGNKVQFDCDVSIGSGQIVTLGNNVQTFTVAQTAALSQVGCSVSGGFAYNFLCKNNSGAGSGILSWADTAVSSNQYTGHAFYRGTSISNPNFRAGIHVGAGGNQFATGDTANALLLWSYDAGGVSYGIELATGANPDVRVRINPGGQTDVLAGLAVTGNLGVFGTTPTTKKTVTGAKAGNAALASLLTQLAAYGLITDSTT